MKLFKWLPVLVLLIAALEGCEKPFGFDSHGEPVPVYYSSAYSELERTVRDMFDSKAVFTWKQYQDLLLKLSSEKFLVLPLQEMRNTYNESKVVIGFRHDIDWNPFKAIEMAKMEKEFGLRATYFILPTASYYGILDKSGLVRNTCIDSVCRALYSDGAEIGIHNDLLTVMITYEIDPFLFNQNELLFLRHLRIPVWGTASHGSPIAKITVPNYQVFSDFATSDSVWYFGKPYPIGEHSLADYGFKYEAYFISYNKYYSDSGGMWNDVGGLDGILERLDSSVPGDRIEILAHPDWWGKNDN